MQAHERPRLPTRPPPQPFIHRRKAEAQRDGFRCLFSAPFLTPVFGWGGAAQNLHLAPAACRTRCRRRRRDRRRRREPVTRHPKEEEGTCHWEMSLVFRAEGS